MADEIGDAVRHHPRLAGTRPGQDQQRPAEGLDGFLLGGVEAVGHGGVRGPLSVVRGGSEVDSLSVKAIAAKEYVARGPRLDASC